MQDAAVKLEEKMKSTLKLDRVHSFASSGFDNECFMINMNKGEDALGTAVGIPFSVAFYAKKKDGTRASKLTTKTINLFMSYCPICGKKLPKSE